MDQNTGRRPVVNDPLAVTGREVLPERNLALSGVRPPSNGGPGGVGENEAKLSAAFGNLGSAFAQHVEKKKDEWVTNGKMAYMAGQTEASLIAGGNRFSHQGFLQLKVRDDVNNWYMREAAGIDEARNRMDPASYQKYLQERRAEFLDGIEDPYARQIATAAFEQYSPQLVQSQFVKNNEFERGERINAFNELLGSTALTSSNVSRYNPSDGPLALSATPVLPVMQASERDRDIGIRTMLGEAANQGSEGLAAVAHVLRNRAVDGRWPSSIAGVALQPQQFSAWNKGAGGNHLVNKYGPGDPVYERAAVIFDQVMSGRHVDPTGSATHYYSPSGMDLLVRQGAQSNRVPRWLTEVANESGGTVTINGHIFAGRSNMPAGPRVSVAQDHMIAASHEAVAQASLTGQLNEVAAREGVDVTGVADTGARNELQELIFGYEGLNPNDRATAVATRMAADLSNGDDTLFRDGGGIATLLQLGASPEDIQRVRNAKVAYDRSQLDNFDAEHEVWRDDVLHRAGTGANSLSELLSEIEDRVRTNQMSDAEAKSVARQASERLRNLGEADNGLGSNPDYLGEVGGLFQQVKTGLDLPSAIEQVQDIGDRYGATADQVQSLIGQMFTMEQNRLDSLRRETEAASQRWETEEARRQEVQTAIERGVGLNLLSGNVETVNEAGKPTSVSAQQYGVNLIRDRHLKQNFDRIQGGEITEAQGIHDAVVGMYSELQSHDVIDREAQAQIIGALTGTIVGPDGAINPEAAQAYDTWLMLRQTPEIKDGYLARMVGDEYVRKLLETAYVLEGGNLTGERALRRAHDIVNDPQRDADVRLATSPQWRARLGQQVEDLIFGKSAPDFWGRLGGDFLPQGELDRARHSTGRAEAYVTARAEAYHMDNTGLDADVSLRMAIQDLENNSTVIAGNLIITQDQTLQDRMGLQAFGPRAPHDAVIAYVQEFGLSDLWGGAYQDAMLSTLAGNVGTFGVGRADHPAIKITYNSLNGYITLDLYKDESLGTVLGDPRHIYVEDIGEYWRSRQRETTAWDDIWNGAFGMIPRKE